MSPYNSAKVLALAFCLWSCQSATDLSAIQTQPLAQNIPGSTSSSLNDNKPEAVVTTAPLTSPSMALPNPSSALSSGPATILAMDKSEAESGEILRITGRNLNQPNLTVLFSLPNHGTLAGTIIKATENEITTYAPWVPSDRSSLIALVGLKQGDAVTPETLNVTVRSQKMNNTQQQMVSQLQQSFANATAPTTTANAIDSLMNQIVAESSSDEDALKKMDYAFAESIQTPEDVEKLILALDELTKKAGFSTKTKIESGPPIKISNDIYYASFDPDKEELPNRIPKAACETTKITDDIQSADDLVVLYINGINTRSDQFCQTKAEIANLVKEAGITAKVSGMYQHSLRETQVRKKEQCNAQKEEQNKILTAKLNAFKQTILTPKLKNKTDLAWDYVLANTEAKRKQLVSCDIPLALSPAVSDVVREIVGQRSANDTPIQVLELANIIETLLKQNKRVVLMPHSQGNFFARQALEKLLEKAAPPLPKILTGPGSTLTESTSKPISPALTKEQITNSVGVIWLANPVELQFTHTIRSKNLVCNDSILEPTCHSYSVSLKEDLVAHLRFMSNTALAGTIGKELVTGPLNQALIAAGKNQLTEVKVNQYYINAYDKAMLNSPILDKAPVFKNVDGGEAGRVSLGLTAHDVNCSYLLDPANPSDFCKSKLSNKDKEIEIELNPSRTGELPRTRVLKSLQALSQNLKRPLVDEIDLRGNWAVEVQWLIKNHIHKGLLSVSKKIDAKTFSGISDLASYDIDTKKYQYSVKQDVEIKIIASSKGQSLVEIRFIGSNPSGYNGSGRYSPDTYYTEWDATKGNPTVLEGSGDDRLNQQASKVKLIKQ